MENILFHVIEHLKKNINVIGSFLCQYDIMSLAAKGLTLNMLEEFITL